MNIVPFVGAVLLLANVAFLQISAVTEIRVINITEAAERNIIPTARDIINHIGLDVLPINNVTVGFEISRAHVNIQLQKGFIKGLSRFRRDGDFTINIESENVTIVAPVRIKTLTGEFLYDYDSTVWHQKGEVDVEIDYVRAVVLFTYNIPTFKLIDANVTVVDLGITLAHLKKHKLTDWYMDVVVDVALEVLRSKVIKSCENALTKTFLARLNVVNDLIDNKMQYASEYINDFVAGMLPTVKEYLNKLDVEKIILDSTS